MVYSGQGTSACRTLNGDLLMAIFRLAGLAVITNLPRPDGCGTDDVRLQDL
jgi:hypothetical protein